MRRGFQAAWSRRFSRKAGKLPDDTLRTLLLTLFADLKTLRNMQEGPGVSALAVISPGRSRVIMPVIGNLKVPVEAAAVPHHGNHHLDDFGVVWAIVLSLFGVKLLWYGIKLPPPWLARPVATTV